MYGAMQGLEEVAGEVVGTGHSLLEACSLGHLQSLLHVTACTMPFSKLYHSSLHGSAM